MLDLIYCAGGNPRLSQIAHEEGFLIGFRSAYAAPAHPIAFVDVEYKQPDFAKHLAVVARSRKRNSANAGTHASVERNLTVITTPH